MKKISDYLLSTVYSLYFGMILIIFHVVQIIAFNIFGHKTQQKVVHILNFFITKGWLLTGTTVRFNQNHAIPENRPVLFLANHQSMFDIPPIIWHLRKYTPIFVSKIELAKGIPSISYNLRKSGAALINRQDSKQAIMEIARLGKFIQENNYAATIFPEGTRSRNGQMKPFAVGGIATLLKRAPDAIVVPIAINGTGRFTPSGKLFPLTSFSKIEFNVLEPIEPKGLPAEDLTRMVQESIQRYFDQHEAPSY
jgi:1-acyl-sn-glycerol-3-phosphate acyltransferase